MGAYYSSIQVRSTNREAVKAALEEVAKECHKKFLLGPMLDGWVGVYPDESGQERCAALLARRCGGIVLHLIVHHSDIFFYNFFKNGELLNEYSSDPDAFEEVSAEERQRLKAKPEIFRELLSSPEDFAEMTRILEQKGHTDESLVEDEFLVEEYRMEKLAKLLGIRNTLTSYEYFTRGEYNGVKDWREFIHVPDQTAEKAAKKAAEAALRAEKQRLKKEGIFRGESIPPGNKRQRVNGRGDFFFEPESGGVLVRWEAHVGPRWPTQWVRLRSSWISKPEQLTSVFGMADPVRPVISASGRWVVFRDKELKLWDTQRQEVVAILGQHRLPVEFSRDEKFLLCENQGEFQLVSLETRQAIQRIPKGQSASFLALHPSNKFVVTEPIKGRINIVNLESGMLEKSVVTAAGFHALQLTEESLDEQVIGIPDTGIVMSMAFDSDGSWIVFATDLGLRVMAWDTLLAATKMTPKPAFSVIPSSSSKPSALPAHKHPDYLYDVAVDDAQHRVLFCGIEGIIRYLNLKDGSEGVLLDPPDEFSMVRLELSPDRQILACLCGPSFEQAQTNEQCWRVQVWNYVELCRVAGLTWEEKP